MTAHIRGIEGIDDLARDLGTTARQTGTAVRRVLNRAGVEMKRNMKSDFSGSRHFKQVARSITYDLHDSAAFGRRNISVEVGPDASRAPSAALAGIAYFGGSPGGGGSVREPDYILEAERDKAADVIADELGKLL